MIKNIIVTSLLFIPALAGAVSSPTDFSSAVHLIVSNVLNPLVGLIMAAALVYFFIGVVKYIQKGGDDKEREVGRKMMVYGIIALSVMVSVWGLVNVLQNTFSLNPDVPIPPTHF